MQLPLPALAVAVEGDLAAELHPRHIHAQKLFPHCMALRRGHLRLFIDDMLEMVDHRAVGDEGQRARQMAVAELAGIVTKEAVCPRPREEFHGHGVHLAALKARPDRLGRDAVAVEIRGKGVARLVRHDLNVVLRAVEVGEDKRNAVLAKARAVAAGPLAGGRQHVQKLVIEHRVEEFAGFGGKRLIEPLALRENVVRGAAGLRVAAAEAKGVIGKGHGIGLAKASGLCLIDGGRDGHDVFDNGGAELLHVLLRVAVAAHAVIAQLGIAVVAQLAAHRVAQLHELVIDLVQLRLVRLVPAALGLPRSQTPRVVRVVFKRGQLRDGVGAAFELDLCAGDQLLIVLHELVFLLQLLDNGGRERLAGDLGVEEHQIAVFRCEFLAERAFQHGSRPRVVIGAKLRPCFVPELLFGVIELVAGVDGVADARERGKRIDVHRQLLLGEERLARGGIIRRGLQPVGQRLQLLLQLVQIGPCIRHFRKFHGNLPSLI